jgi:hypothetical protein
LALPNFGLQIYYIYVFKKVKNLTDFSRATIGYGFAKILQHLLRVWATNKFKPFENEAVLGNEKFDALFRNVFILRLYMFRAASAHHQEGQIVLMHHLV